MRFSAELHPGTKSRPLYHPIAADPAGRLHLIVTDAFSLPPDLEARFSGLPVEIWTATANLAALAARLAIETAGIRLYVVGTEAFMWDVARVAQAAGLGFHEIAMQPGGPPQRRVQCVHCKTFSEPVKAPAFDCPGCGVRLLVRDHFSRRLGAFQGIALYGVTRGETA